MFNYEQLRDEKLKGYTWRSASDTEVFLECFAKYGYDCFNWYNGQFAMAIWDKQEQKLILLRDQVGIKPLYYYFKDQTLVFASELKAIKEIIPSLELNREVIPAYLHLGYIPHPHTIYKDIKKVPAGSFLEINVAAKGQLSLSTHSYWKIRDKISSSVLKDEAMAKKELHSLLTDAVTGQLISDVPIGTFLSGGTDSSIVTAIASKVSSKKVKTFSIAVTDGKVNEAPFAAGVAKFLGTDHHELPITQKEILQMVPELKDVYDEPFSDSSAFPTMLVSKLARKHVTVVLSGDGGDELFGGYNSYLWAKRLKNPALKMAAPLIYAGTRALNSRYQRAGKLFEKHKPVHFKSHVFSQDQYFFSERELKKLLVNPLFDFADINYSLRGRKLDPMEELSFWDMENYLKDDLLVKVDRASMKYSLETRVPLLDYRMVEFSLNLSSSLKITNKGVMKYLLKEVLYDLVPRSLVERPKWGFGIPLVKWLKTDLKWMVDKYCSKEMTESAGVINYEVLADIVKRYNKGVDYLYNRIWTVIVLHQFLDSRES